jgi:hypothetical protein
VILDLDQLIPVAQFKPCVAMGVVTALSQIVAATLVVAVQKWGRDGCTSDMREIVNASVDLVRSGLGPLG